MNKIKFTIIVLMLGVFSFAQETPQRFSVNFSYGPAYNFFVDYGRPVNKQDGYFIPPVNVLGGLQFYQKNKVGTISSINLSYIFNKKNQLSIGYTRELHYGKFKGAYTLSNGTPIFVDDIKLRHLNEFFEFNYKRALNNKLNWFATIGFYVLNPSQSEIEIYPEQSFVEIRQRTQASSRLQEGGFSLGIEHYFYKSGKFHLGVSSKLYFTASTGEFETFSVTPILEYKF